jgi:hypothetical protein
MACRRCLSRRLTYLGAQFRRSDDGLQLIFPFAPRDGSPTNSRCTHCNYLHSGSNRLRSTMECMPGACTGAYQPPGETGSFTRTSYYGGAQSANYPVIYVSQSDAKVLCVEPGRACRPKSSGKGSPRRNRRCIRAAARSPIARRQFPLEGTERLLPARRLSRIVLSRS